MDGKTYASWRIPDPASKRGDSPMLEMMDAVGELLFIDMAPPTMRRLQKAKM